MSASDADPVTTRKCQITPIVVRIFNAMSTPMYVTGYDGKDIDPKPVLPMPVNGNRQFTDVTYFQNADDRWDWIYQIGRAHV